MYKILANTIFLGKDVHFLPECHSTNDKALQLIRDGKAKEGSLVITNRQTRGKGQRGNTWVTEHGQNLTLSLVLCPTFLDLSEQFYLNMVVSNGILKFLREYVPDIQVKWPNDLVVSGIGKIGGILIENIVGSSGWEYAVVGMGLNINQRNFEAGKGTSLSLLTGSQFDLEELVKLLISHLEQGYISLKKGRKAEIKTHYLHHLFLRGEWANYAAEGKHFEGKIVGISEVGKLQMEVRDGSIVSFDLKEVSFPSF